MIKTIEWTITLNVYAKDVQHAICSHMIITMKTIPVHLNERGKTKLAHEIRRILRNINPE